MREFLYPIMQGYDSVAVKSDVEIGGYDQLFNLKAGREIQNYFNMPKQNIMCLQMLEGTDGRKMSTSWDNVITVVDDPYDMFNKIMEIKDELIVKYFTLCTDRELAEIENFKSGLEKTENNPRDIKMILACDIVTLYHNEKSAAQAKANFIEVFQNNGTPENLPEILGEATDTIGTLVVNSGLVESKSEWKRLVDSKGVTDTDGNTINDYKKLAENITIKIGKKKFLKIRV